MREPLDAPGMTAKVSAHPPTEAWERLGRAAGEGGWLCALRQEVPSGSDLWRYATDAREGDALCLLPAVKTGRALFWGNALGVLPFLLAEHFARVAISDPVRPRLAFARHRQRQEAIANVRAVAAPSLDGEVRRDGRFHLILVGEEFSADGGSLPSSDPDLAARLAPLLEPEGILVYSVRPERPAGAASLPARLGTALTYRRDARRLRAAGFVEWRLYWRRPENRPYQAYVPLDPRNVTGYYLRSASTAPGVGGRVRRSVVSLANAFGILPSLVQNLLIFARKA